MLFATLGLLLLGYPVAFTLGGVALLFAAVGYASGYSPSLGAIPLRIFGTISNETLIAVPLFILMGVVLEKARIAEDLLAAMGWAFRKVPGGLSVSVTVVGALLAASTGIVGATVVTMGLIALPSLLKAGYSPRLATGSIAASGTLGQIIPPSIVLVFLADQLSTAYQASQRDMGNFAPDPFSVADLFAASFLPGLLLVAFYISYQIIFSIWSPPKIDIESSEVPEPRLADVVQAILPPLGLVVCVLGSILGGVATPTEAASLGAIGAFILAGSRQSTRRGLALGLPLTGAVVLVFFVTMKEHGVAITEGSLGVGVAVIASGAVLVGLFSCLASLLRNGLLMPALRSSIEFTAMVFAIMIGATIFSLIFRDLGGDETVQSLLQDLPGGTLGAVLIVMAVMFALGFFLDFLEIVFVVVPLVAPILLKLPMPDGTPMNPAWLGVMMAINLQTSFLTPPFGFALFYLRGAAPDSVRTSDIYRGVAPFVGLQLLALVFIWFFPQIATWLPSYMLS
ncbi:TRAP transporter large permease subunit [Roseibium sp. H3510]|uniref:TRAP transporter large permease subunit n=2 Tax=Roseibium algae TaxID=3123038 RepID=A0ABU8TG59_9HYPH